MDFLDFLFYYLHQQSLPELATMQNLRTSLLLKFGQVFV